MSVCYLCIAKHVYLPFVMSKWAPVVIAHCSLFDFSFEFSFFMFFLLMFVDENIKVLDFLLSLSLPICLHFHSSGIHSNQNSQISQTGLKTSTTHWKINKVLQLKVFILMSNNALQHYMHKKYPYICDQNEYYKSRSTHSTHIVYWRLEVNATRPVE